MVKVIKEDVSVGSGIIGTYQRMPQKLERVFAEFIDNSTQSFIDNEKELIKVNKSPICRVNITWKNDEIIILDNAFGMSHEDFKRALKLNKPKEIYSENSRSRYGMGLKIAATYLGDWYSIETTQLNSTEKYYSIIDVEEWKKHNPTEIDNVVSDTLAHKHYTKIVIKKLLKKLNASTETKLRKQLATIYKKDLDLGNLEIILNDVPINSVDPEIRLNPETGTEYLRTFEEQFLYDGKIYNYSGWIGILKTADVDGAGFTLFQSSRGIDMNYKAK